jgi:DNA-binding CsgD family transcriptional regulator
MRQSPNPVRRIATLFALTGAEERLLAHLAAGSSLTTTAESLRVSIHTARSQLKAIQRKTGWRTQGELVRMVQQLSIVDPQFSR